MNTPAPKTSPDAALGNLMAAALDVHAAPEQPAVPDDTLARTGNTADHQAGWFAGIDHARAEARKSAGVGTQQLQERADKVVIANATGNPDLFQEAVKDLLAAVRMFRPAPAAGDARGATERHTIEGTISFMRSDAESQVCVCCPPKTGHIFSRGVDWDAWETGAPEHFGRGPDVLVRRYATGINANEGKRVRVTVEVLPDDLAAQRKGDA